jgi:hypothetical protein
MTEDEAADYCERSEVKYTFENGIIYHEGPATVYLLSKHFDLFGLIEAGLAIDQTKKQPI